MFKRVILLGVFCALSGLGTLAAPPVAGADPPDPSARGKNLTLAEALQRTLRDNPALAAARAEEAAVEAEVHQAGIIPNPELVVTLENVAGDGAYRGTDAAEWTVELSQPLELGGKRRLRREAAELGRQLAASELLLTRAEALAATRRHFVAVLAAQAGLQRAGEQAELAEASLQAAEERIRAGKAPAVDRLRLQGEAVLARLAVDQARRTLETARLSLASAWGGGSVDFERVDGDLANLPELPALADSEATLELAPATVSLRTATAMHGNELAQARSRRIPDPALTVGWRQFRESDEDALLFGVAIPLPVFNQGTEAVAAASQRLNGARERERGARLAARSVLRNVWQEFADARAEAVVFRQQVVPAAVEGFAAAEFGYRAGKFGLLELLDSQRALFEARQRQLAAETACHLAAIELQRLQGTVDGVATP